MREFMAEAWTCWKSMIQNEKYLVLLLGTLLYLWYRRAKKVRGRPLPEELDALEPGAARQWLWYGTLALSLAVFPPTAALLARYQTSVYDIAWIFALVPITAMIAYGASRVFMDCQEKYCGNSAWRTAGLAALSLAVLLLCGNLAVQGNGAAAWGGATNGTAARGGMANGAVSAAEAENLQTARQLLDDLTEKGNTENICLWGPAELMAYVRALDGEILLPYGRNMWEEDLGAFFYDPYLPEVTVAYHWMETYTACARGQGEWPCDEETTRACLEAALAQGVNRIVLPREEEEAGEALLGEVLRILEEAGHPVTRERVQEYDVLEVG